ncbi:DNA-directed RNA polymerase II 19 kDa polypeptide [Spraguea lophii 42_110]|uniref:DNA-directed RNA polymerase II 19 kDa polypeptide n=1 Tax=Spraguea lophii (strain 42_110) TaxID=1358809 RepID=S7XSV0_SPRLO|nr:DNA-directed RNA polymerase II 19 kDa polypeptide [Spraguea lophii 42_110]
MFFLTPLTHTLFLPPNTLTSSIHNTIHTQLYQEKEGSCTSDHGYILAITTINNIGAIIVESTGHIRIKIKYTAIVLKPEKGEILDANVNEINKLGIFASCGPMNIFISNYQIPTVMNIEKNTQIRLKIIGTKIDTKKVYAIGTINEDSLGIIY